MDTNTENYGHSPQSKDQGLGTTEECSVCRNEMIDPATLSNCSHEFCYVCIVCWLTKGSGQFCPMCKAPVNYIKRKGTDEEITLKQLQTDIVPGPTASKELVTEKRIVSRKIRSCRRLMNQIEETIRATAGRVDNQDRTDELQTMKQQCVTQLNALQMLRDDIDHGAVKEIVISRVEFRRLIYERGVIFEGFSGDLRVVSKKEFLANIEHYRSVLRSFLSVELKALPTHTQPRVDGKTRWYFNTLIEVAPTYEDEYTNRIFSLVTEQDVRNIKDTDVVQALDAHISMRCAQLFLSQMISLVQSKRTYLDWCGRVTYRSLTDRGGEVDQSEVVTVDDVEDDSQEIDEDPPRRSRFPISNPLDHIFGHSSHHPDRNAPLRLGPNANNPFRTFPQLMFPPIPPAGPFWNDLTRMNDRTTRTASNRRAVSNRDRGSDSDHIISENENDTDEDVQIVDNDGTIVLDDTVGSSSSARKKSRKEKSRERRSQKRKFESSHEDHWRKPNVDLPNGLVEDVQQLIVKYNMPMVQTMDILVGAAHEAIARNSAVGKPKTLQEALGSLRSPSSSTRIQPDDALQLAGYIARNGIGVWSPNAPTKSTRED